MATLSERRRQRLAIAVIGVCGAVAVYAPDPDQSQRSLVSLHEFLHVPGFALILAMLLVAFSHGAGAWHQVRPLHLLGAFSAAVAIGIAVEFAQAARGGAIDPWDVVRDAGGAAAAALVAASLARDRRLPVRWGLRSAAAALAASFLVPTLAVLVDEAWARRQFPVLADFSATSELGRFTWSPRSTASLELVGSPGRSRRALRLALSPGQYPGLSFKFFPRDWRGWREIVLACTNLGRAPLPLTVRIDDLQHNHEYSDRYNRTFALAPGRNDIHIPLADVESAPRGRKLDLTRVNSVILFAKDLQESRELLFYEFRLTR